MIDCIKNGATTIFDHHASPGCVPGSLFRIADAARDLGLRTCLCYEVSDRDDEAIAEQGIEENAAYIRDCQQSGDSLRRALFGLHASFTLNDDLLRRSAAMAKELGVGCHIHTAEALSDLTDCQRRYGKRVVERLSDFGVLGPQSIAGHCVHIDEQEMDLLQQQQALVVHNPESNMGNAVGCAPVLAMLQRGVRVGLGTDGYTGDMLESLKVANLLHKHQQQDAAVAWAEPHEMLFGRNAEFASACFDATLGQLVPGALADVIVVDYDPPTPLTAENLNAHILFGCSGRAVRTTVVNGRVLMQNRRLLVADAAEIAAKSRLQAAQLWQRF
jgi:putative selenium metabolism protein SsnA